MCVHRECVVLLGRFVFMSVCLQTESVSVYHLDNLTAVLFPEHHSPQSTLTFRQIPGNKRVVVNLIFHQ